MTATGPIIYWYQPIAGGNVYPTNDLDMLKRWGVFYLLQINWSDGISRFYNASRHDNEVSSCIVEISTKFVEQSYSVRREIFDYIERLHGAPVPVERVKACDVCGLATFNCICKKDEPKDSPEWDEGPCPHCEHDPCTCRYDNERS